jgi:hypothetical protein
MAQNCHKWALLAVFFVDAPGLHRDIEIAEVQGKGSFDLEDPSGRGTERVAEEADFYGMGYPAGEW